MLQVFVFALTVVIVSANLLITSAQSYRYRCALRRETILLGVLMGNYMNGDGVMAFETELQAQRTHPFRYHRFWKMPPSLKDSWWPE